MGFGLGHLVGAQAHDKLLEIRGENPPAFTQLHRGKVTLHHEDIGVRSADAEAVRCFINREQQSVVFQTQAPSGIEVLVGKAIVDMCSQGWYRLTMTLMLFRREEVTWETAGMVSVERGLVADSGLPFSSRVRPKEAWIDGDYLFWSGWQEETMFTPFDSTGMLDAFVRFQSSEDIPPFAVRFGTLQLCAHGLPISHTSRFVSLWGDDKQYADRHPGCLPDGDWIPEPVDRWMDFSNAARALLNIAAAIHSGSPLRREDWAAAYKAFLVDQDDLPKDGAWELEHPLQESALMLSDFVNEWLAMGDVRPRLEWELGDPQIEFKTSTFGAIGVQLMQAVTRVHGLTLCSSCGRPYLRQGRKAPAGRRNYCPDCGSGAALRDAQRAHRNRKRGERGGTT